MGRIRTIKPEFPQSESIGKLSRDARLLFIQLWTLVDDEGRTRAASRMLASLLYPYDEDAPRLIDDWIAELEDENHVRRYVVDGCTYLEVVNFLEHQKIDHPSKSKLPPFDESSRILAKPRRSLAPDQGSRIKDQGGEGIPKGAEPPSTPSGAPAPEPPPPPFLSPKDKVASLIDWSGIDEDSPAGEEQNVPDDLPPLVLGNWLLQQLSIPHSRGLASKFAKCIDLIARDERVGREQAARRLLVRAKEHPPGNGKWPFWLDDGEWKPGAGKPPNGGATAGTNGQGTWSAEAIAAREQADKERERQDYLDWLGMSATFREQNPWRGRVFEREIA